MTLSPEALDCIARALAALPGADQRHAVATWTAVGREVSNRWEAYREIARRHSVALQ